MSVGLRNLSERERQEAIERRLRSEIKGLGYWAAYDARHGRLSSPKTEKKVEE